MQKSLKPNRANCKIIKNWLNNVDRPHMHATQDTDKSIYIYKTLTTAIDNGLYQYIYTNIIRK